MNSKRAITNLLLRLQWTIHAGGHRAFNHGNASPVDPKNPYKPGSIEHDAWQYGFDNRIAYTDPRDWHLDLPSPFTPRNEEKGLPSFYPCLSVSMDGHSCNLPLGHYGVHCADISEISGFFAQRFWTTEKQSVDSGGDCFGTRIHRFREYDRSG